MFAKTLAIQILLAALAVSAFPTCDAAEPSLPPFSIYGTPQPPSPNTILNRTGEYWGPYIKDVYVTWFTTSQATIEALVNGYIQYDAQGVTNIQEYNQLASYAASGEVGLDVTPYNGFNFIGFKYDSYPFNNTFFRLGIQRLVDYRQVAASLYNGILGIASPYYFLPTLYQEYFSPEQAKAYQDYGSYNLTAAIYDFEMAGLVYHRSLGYWSYQNGTRVDLKIYVPSSVEDFARSILAPLISSAASINLSISIVTVATETLIYTLLPTESADMYFIGFGAGPPAVPTTIYTLLGPSPVNQLFIHYYDPKAWDLLTKLYNSPTASDAVDNAKTAGVFLQENVPIIILAWGTSIIPVSLIGWRGYIFQAQVGYAFPGNIHPQGKIFGGLYRYADLFPPTDLNVYTQVSGADYAVLSMMWLTPMQLSYNATEIFPWAVYNWSIKPSYGLMPNGHFYNGSVATLHFLQNIVWQDGAPLTAIDLNFTIWYLDAGGFTSNPYNKSESVIEYAPGVKINLTEAALNPSSEWFGSIPNLAGTYVPPNDPYTIEIFFNSTSIFNIERPFPALWTMPILPEHVFYNISQSTYAAEPPSAYLSQQVMAGPYMFVSYSLTQGYVTLTYFPSYFLANPYSNTYTVRKGESFDFKLNVTVFGGKVVETASGYVATFKHVDNGVGALYILDKETLKVVVAYNLENLGGGMYGALIDTQNLSVGEYYLVAQVNWTGTPYYYYTGQGSTFKDQYYYHVYGVLNITPPTLSGTSTTTSTTTSTATTGSSTSQTAGQTLQPVASYFVLVLVVALLLAVVAALIYRRRSR